VRFERIGIDHVALSSDFNHGGSVAGWANEGEASNVAAELVRRNYGEARIAKLRGGNVLRALGNAQAAGANRGALNAPPMGDDPRRRLNLRPRVPHRKYS
jgi:hypothetical protein